MNKVLSAPIRKAHQIISTNEIKPSEICDAALKLSHQVKCLNPFISITEDLARKQSRDADERQSQGKSLGVLDGIPIAIKDNYCTKDQLTTCASKMLSNFVPGYDATVYEKLKNAGAILIGKTNLDQFAMGSGTVDSYYGPTKNLWGSELMKNYSFEGDGSYDYCQDQKAADDWHIAGGSSGGSAVAVSTGTVFAAIGSDTGGSTRNPASYCGLVGYKPSYGLVSRHGLIPLVNSMDVPGILTRTIEDSLTILNTIAGPDPKDSTTVEKPYKPYDLPASIDLKNLTVGIPREYHIPQLSEEVEFYWNHISKLLTEAGCNLVPVSLPHSEFSIVCYSVLNQCEVASNMARYDGLEFGIRSQEDYSTEELFAKTRAEGFNDVVRSRILTGNYFLLSENYDEYFVRAMKVRRLISQDFDNVWNDNIDVLLTPTTLSDAPKYKDFTKMDNQTQCSIQDFCTQSANMAGIPAISIPVGLSKNGLPLSVQLMAPFFEDHKLLTVAKWIENTVAFPKLTLKNNELLV